MKHNDNWSFSKRFLKSQSFASITACIWNIFWQIPYTTIWNIAVNRAKKYGNSPFISRWRETRLHTSSLKPCLSHPLSILAFDSSSLAPSGNPWPYAPGSFCRWCSLYTKNLQLRLETPDNMVHIIWHGPYYMDHAI